MSLDYLSLYGNSFQTKIIASLIGDKTFLAQSMDILSPDYFESDANKYIVGIIMDYHKQYSTPPTFDVFKSKIHSVTDEIMKLTIVSQLKDAYNFLEQAGEPGTITDLPYVKNEFLGFCKHKKLKESIILSVDLLKSANYDEIQLIMNNALKAGMDRDIGLQWTMMDVDERYSKDARNNVIPTEWPVINEICQGGIGGGDLGVLVGNAGGGKSWALVSLGLHAASIGKTVVHFTLELNAEYTGRRYDSRMTGIAAQNLKYHTDEIKRKKEALSYGQLIIKYFPPKMASVTTLRAQIDRMISLGIHPHMIIVDYADLLVSENVNHQKAGSYFEMGSIYESLRGMSGEYQIPVWTASQANKTSEGEEVITGEKVAESYKKVMTADLIISVSRRIEDKLANTARWFVIKNRYGADGLTFPSKMDASIGKIDIHSASSVAGSETRKEMKNSHELLRKELANRFQDFE